MNALKALKSMSLVLMSFSVVGATANLSHARSGNGKWQKLEASYEVPAPVEFAKFANFPMTDLRLRDRGAVQQMNYLIPRELTGREVHIHVTSTDNGKTFKGPLAYMTCEGNDCVVKYPGLEIDLAEVRAYLQSKGIQGEELALREKVVGFFKGETPRLDEPTPSFLAGGDPGGVIHIKR